MIEGKIYKIINKDFPGLVYYGSTTQKLNRRLTNHRRALSSTSNILINGNEEIILIQTKIYNDKYELWNREKWFIQNFKCINKQIPNPTNEEKLYKQRLTRKKNKKDKKYYEKHKENIHSNNRRRVICPSCLKNLSYDWYRKHYKKCYYTL